MQAEGDAGEGAAHDQQLCNLGTSQIIYNASLLKHDMGMCDAG